MKGDCIYFDKRYNCDGCCDVKEVYEVYQLDTTKNNNRVPVHSNVNSVIKVYKYGKLIQERYYDRCGDVYLDIDYTDHNTPKIHTVVPHKHRWIKNKDGSFTRLKGERI